MRPSSRREFVFWSSGAALGAFAAPGLAAPLPAGGDAETSTSGLVTGEPKPLKRDSIPGFLSAEQIAPHHRAHYGGALRGYAAADARIEQAIRSGERLDPAAFGALKRAINSKGNSVLLHELYFDGMTGEPPEPDDALLRAIERRFGSLDRWKDDFIASANAAAGWAMLVRHPVNGRLYNVVSDEHAIGVLWTAAPLIVIDTYEHAFYIDYKNEKSTYVEKFTDHIDWAEAAARYRGAGR